MLALIRAVKYFPCYLLGRKFLVRTEQSAVSYLRKFADTIIRLMRLSLKLSELDFIEHRPGSKIWHVHALSRHVSAVVNESSLDKVFILQAQEKGEFCTKQSPGTYARKPEFFTNDDGVTYRRQRHDRYKIVVPSSLIHDVVKANHDPKYVAHTDIKSTHNLIFLHYWWPGMRKSIAKFVLKRNPCQRRKDVREQLRSKFPRWT